MKKLLACAIALTLPMVLSSVSASDLTEKCDTCHGKNGNSKDGKVPNIAGFSAGNIEDILNTYRDGDRKGIKYKPENGDETDMVEIAKKLSDDEIQAVAKFYSGQKFAMHEQAVDTAKAAKGKKKFKKKCDKCHTDGGIDPSDDAGLLLGQWKPYLEQQFKLFSAGERSMPKKMKKKFKKLSDDDKLNIIEYLASGK